MTDQRYTVGLEFCGQATAKFVARFLGEWLGWFDTKRQAMDACAEHNIARLTGVQNV
jgi:hypothetical protein